MPNARSNASKSKGSSKSGNSDSSSSNDSVPQVHPAVSESRAADANAVSPVQPIEVVRNVPEVGNEAAETVRVVNKPNLQENGQPLVTAEDDPAVDDAHTAAKKSRKSEKHRCWNCANHGISTDLDEDGVCPECGFEKDKLYNGNLEAEKAHQRALAEAGY